MKYAVIYNSSTGNTKFLAEALRDHLTAFGCGENQRGEAKGNDPDTPVNTCFAEVREGGETADADVVFAGFWTDKGGCGEEMASFLERLRGKKVFLFGTAGFGQREAYFDRILSNVASHLDDSNTVVGTWMCQGRMPAAVRRRYEGMMETEPQKAKQMLENFDAALAHPNEEDAAALLKKAQKTLENMREGRIG